MTGKIKTRKETRTPAHPATTAYVNSICGILKSKTGAATKTLLEEHRKELTTKHTKFV